MGGWRRVALVGGFCVGGALGAQGTTPSAPAPGAAPVGGTVSAAPGDTSVQATHQALRDLKARLVAAVNARDQAALVQDLHPEIWFTAMNNETFHGLDGAQRYWTRMLVGASRVVDSMSITADADSLAILLPNGTAISTGTSVAHFKMMTGTEFDVPLRWSATLIRTAERWQVASIHFSANVFENPVTGSVTRLALPLVAVAGVVGIGVGWLFGRSRRTPG